MPKSCQADFWNFAWGLRYGFFSRPIEPKSDFVANIVNEKAAALYVATGGFCFFQCTKMHIYIIFVIMLPSVINMIKSWRRKIQKARISLLGVFCEVESSLRSSLEGFGTITLLTLCFKLLKRPVCANAMFWRVKYIHLNEHIACVFVHGIETQFINLLCLRIFNWKKAVWQTKLLPGEKHISHLLMLRSNWINSQMMYLAYLKERSFMISDRFLVACISRGFVVCCFCFYVLHFCNHKVVCNKSQKHVDCP